MSEEGYIIEKNVEMPRTRRKRKWAFIDDMKVGDSFLCPDKERPTAYKIFQRAGWTMTGRSLPKGKIRIWRTS